MFHECFFQSQQSVHQEVRPKAQEQKSLAQGRQFGEKVKKSLESFTPISLPKVHRRSGVDGTEKNTWPRHDLKLDFEYDRSRDPSVFQREVHHRMLFAEGKPHEVGKTCLCVKAMRQLRRVHSCGDLLFPQFLPRHFSCLLMDSRLDASVKWKSERTSLLRCTWMLEHVRTLFSFA